MSDTPWPYPFPNAVRIDEGASAPPFIDIQIDDPALNTSLRIRLINHLIPVPAQGIRVFYTNAQVAADDVSEIVNNAAPHRVIVHARSSEAGPGGESGQIGVDGGGDWFWQNLHNAITAWYYYSILTFIIIAAPSNPGAFGPAYEWLGYPYMSPPQPGDSPTTDPIAAFLAYFRSTTQAPQ